MGRGRGGAGSSRPASVHVDDFEGKGMPQLKSAVAAKTPTPPKQPPPPGLPPTTRPTPPATKPAPPSVPPPASLAPVTTPKVLPGSTVRFHRQIRPPLSAWGFIMGKLHAGSETVIGRCGLNRIP